MSNFSNTLKSLSAAIALLVLCTSFTYVWNGPIDQRYEANDSVSTVNGTEPVAEPKQQEKDSTEKVDKPQEKKSNPMSTLSINVLHYLIYKLKLSDILSDDGNNGERERIIAMA